MKKIFLGILLCGAVLTSCEEKKKTEATVVSNETNTTPTETTEQENTSVTSENTTADNQKTGEVKLNPPHGEPGHRCEIPVGAPLDSKPGQAPQTMPTSQPQAGQPSNGQGFLSSGNTQQQQPTTTQTQQVAQQTAPGMKGKPNPAHGQPGHRCDVQVGQPLP